MNKQEQFFDVIKKEMTVLLATAEGERVTMRAVSPVFCRNAILIFTSRRSKKYEQLQMNPHGCIAAGPFFAEVNAEFCGPAMLAENEPLRKIYCEKFPGAFDEDAVFGGRNAEFLLLKPTRLSGWGFENDVPTADGIPTVPFEIFMP